MKRFISALALIIVFCAPAFALSDFEYLKLKKDSDFREADKELNRVYNEAQKFMSKSEFEKIKREQRQWIAKGRDDYAKHLMLNGYSKTEAYTEATFERAKEIYGQIPYEVENTEEASVFLGTYYDSDGLCLTICKDDDPQKKILWVGFSIPRRNSPDMFGYPNGNVLEVEFDYSNTDLMYIVKYEAGIKKEGNLDLRARLTMLDDNRIKVEASPDLDRLFEPVSGIFIRGDD